MIFGIFLWIGREEEIPRTAEEEKDDGWKLATQEAAAQSVEGTRSVMPGIGKNSTEWERAKTIVDEGREVRFLWWFASFGDMKKIMEELDTA